MFGSGGKTRVNEAPHSQYRTLWSLLLMISVVPTKKMKTAWETFCANKAAGRQKVVMLPLHLKVTLTSWLMWPETDADLTAR